MCVCVILVVLVPLKKKYRPEPHHVTLAAGGTHVTLAEGAQLQALRRRAHV